MRGPAEPPPPLSLPVSLVPTCLCSAPVCRCCRELGPSAPGCFLRSVSCLVQRSSPAQETRAAAVTSSFLRPTHLPSPKFITVNLCAVCPSPGDAGHSAATPPPSFLYYYYFYNCSYGTWNYWARGQLGAVAAGVHHSHSNARSEPRLQPMP